MLLNVGCKCGFAEYEGQYNIFELWLQFKPLCTSFSRLVVLTSCRCKRVELSEFETGWGSVGVQPLEMKIERLCSRRLSVQTLTAASQRGSSFASCRQLRAKRLGLPLITLFRAMDISPADCCCNLLQSIGYWSGRPRPAPPRCGEWTTEAGLHGRLNIDITSSLKCSPRFSKKISPEF